MRPSNGIALRGNFFAVMYSDGTLSDRAFRSPYRAAMMAMEDARIDWWPRIAELGVRVVAVNVNEGGDNG